MEKFVGERDNDSSRGESDDVGPPPVHIGKLARIGVIAAPTSGVRTEGRKVEDGWRKVSVSSGERDKDSGRGESDDVGLPVTVHIGNLARIGVIAAPTSGVRTEGRKFEGGWRKVSVSSGERDKDAGRGESDDVGLPVTVHVGNLARIGVIAAPTSGVRTEGRKFEGGWRKVSVSSGERNKDAGLGESDDVGLPVTVHIRQLALVEVVTDPIAGVWTEGRKFEGRGLENVDRRDGDRDRVGVGGGRVAGRAVSVSAPLKFGLPA